MNTALHHRFEGGINLLLAVTLSVIAIGSGILIWEWHGAHSSANHKHAKSASHHQHAKKIGRAHV